MTSPLSSPANDSHDDIARQAHQLWQQRGCPTGCDDEIWLEAERELRNSPRKTTPAKSAPHAEEQKETLTAAQKQEARAPQVAHHTAPHAKPAETGKPVWSKPHSS